MGHGHVWMDTEIAGEAGRSGGPDQIGYNDLLLPEEVGDIAPGGDRIFATHYDPFDVPGL